MKLDKVANSGNDEFYTLYYAIKPLLKYIKSNSTIWCPFNTDESLFVKTFGKLGHTVIYTHINDGYDFFETTLPECDYIISNPFNLKSI